MRTRWILLALACAGCSAQSATAPPSPLAPAARGEQQCYSPDNYRKTCQSMAAYRARADGGFDNTAVVLVSPSPAIVMSAVSFVRMKQGQACSVLRTSDVDQARFTIDGRAASRQETAALRRQLEASMLDRVNHEICTAYAPNGDALTAQASIDGVRQPGLDQSVIWVAPSEGYAVAP